MSQYVRAVPKRLFVLLPPSESKTEGGHAKSRTDTFSESLSAPRRVLGQLLIAHTSCDEAELTRTFKSRGALLERSLRANRDTIAGVGPNLPAWRRYSGVVWVHLDPASLSPAQRARLLVPSALYGLTTGTDDIGDYRLAMNASINGVGRLATYWRDALSDALVEHCRGAVVVNLLTNEYAAAIDTEKLADATRLVTANFLSADEQRAVGHDAKAAKGFLARSVLRGGLGAVDGLEWMGWRARRAGNHIIATAPAQRQMPLPASRTRRTVA